MRKNIIQEKAELLSPAGSMEALKAAVENGADAVYLGGTAFNARINANNFELKEIKEAIDYAHLRDVKVYLTMNTLLLDEELPEAIYFIAAVYAFGIDSVIIQDMGLAYLLKKYFPDLPMHLSTQGTVYNASGVMTAKNLGFERVVLAREVSLDEIKNITSKTDAEIEVFVHGAICLCYSGQCQMSRVIGGRSGNRGECAQPCRLPYTNEKGEKAYFLSPRDLSYINAIPELIEAGVSSFKIEGRMKSPEYVAIVTRLFRKYIDKNWEQLNNNENYLRPSKEELRELTQIFNRGDFYSGYLYNDEKDFFSDNTVKNKGICIGEVEKILRGKLLEVKLLENEELELGDGVEIESSNGDRKSNIVTYLKKKNSKSEIIIGDFGGKIQQNSKVYKTSSKKQLLAARESYSPGNKKTGIYGEFIAALGQPAELSLFDNKGNYASIKSEMNIEKAINKSTSTDDIRKQLSKLGDTPFEFENLNINIDEGIFIPSSVLNKLRRDGIELLRKEKIKSKERKKVKLDNLYFEVNNLKKGTEDKNLIVLKEQAMISDESINTKERKKKILYLPKITKGNMDREIEINPKKFFEKYDEVIVENLGWIKELKGLDINVLGGAGLNVYNEFAENAFQEIDVNIIEYANESKNSSEDFELMIIENKIQAKKLIDRKGKEFTVLADEKTGKTIIGS
ncbi:MAG: peptidase U32 family protein [Anaerovoracaceae bacterium]